MFSSRSATLNPQRLAVSKRISGLEMIIVGTPMAMWSSRATAAPAIQKSNRVDPKIAGDQIRLPQDDGASRGNPGSRDRYAFIYNQSYSSS